MILLLRQKATREQLDAMLQALEFYVKAAVDPAGLSCRGRRASCRL
jgi:hypothetical protein